MSAFPYPNTQSFSISLKQTDAYRSVGLYQALLLYNGSLGYVLKCLNPFYNCDCWFEGKKGKTHIE